MTKEKKNKPEEKQNSKNLKRYGLVYVDDS